MVLRGRAGQRGAADVDVLDTILIAGATCQGRLERVEVGHQQIDRRDLVLLHLGDVFRQVAPAQQAAMDLRHQCLDAPVEDFGKAGMGGHINHRDAGITQRLGRAAGGEDLDPAGRQRAGEINQAGLVGHRHQGTADGNDIDHGATPAGVIGRGIRLQAQQVQRPGHNPALIIQVQRAGTAGGPHAGA